MSFNKRLAAIIVTAALGVSLLGAIPVMAAAPSISGVVITPDPAYVDSLLTATAQDWVDTDGDTESYLWQWQKYNTDTTLWEDIDGATTDQLDLAGTLNIGGTPTTVATGDQFKVLCTPYDTLEQGAQVGAEVTIANSPPSLAGVSIEPTTATTTSLLTAIPNGWFDADGDAEGYQWQWQKYNTDTTLWEDIDGATTDQLDLAGTLNIGGTPTTVATGDQFKVICTPDDGTDTGLAVEASVTITVLDVATGIDVKPGSDTNPINLTSKGVIPVALYTSDGFDATTVVIESIKFGPNEIAPAHYAYEDIDDDGDIDLILHFRTQEVGLTAEDTQVSLSGETEGGTSFTGSDTITIVPAKTQASIMGNEAAPGQNQEPGENGQGNAYGHDTAPGQNQDEGEGADGNGNGRDSAPGQNKEPGQKAQGKANGKNK